MRVVYGAGALVAAEQGDRRAWADHRVRLELGVVPTITAPVVSQVSRSPRQTGLRRLLRGCEVVAFAPNQAHAVGALLGRSDTTDVVDAHIVVSAASAEAVILTSDPDDLRRLVAHAESPSPHVMEL